MTPKDKVRAFLRDISGISIGYKEITFFSEDKLDQGQVGYSVDTNNSSLITGQEGDWEEDWLVIGVDGLLGNPIFVDMSSKPL